MKHIARITILTFLTLSVHWLFGGQVTLGWNANPEPDVSAYVVYHGPGPRNYTQATNVGNVTKATVRDLDAGPRYFALTAVNTSGLESDFSNELPTVILPAVITNHPPTITALTNLTIFRGETTNVLFTIGDVETDPTNLIVAAISTDAALLRNDGVQLAHNGPYGEIVLNPVPDALGKTRVMVIVSDKVKHAFASFTLTVLARPNPYVFVAGADASSSAEGPWTNIISLDHPIVYDSNLFYRAWGRVERVR